MRNKHLIRPHYNLDEITAFLINYDEVMSILPDYQQKLVKTNTTYIIIEEDYIFNEKELLLEKQKIKNDIKALTDEYNYLLLIQRKYELEKELKEVNRLIEGVNNE